ncbi:MAG TPA: inositol 2-dehydrogenase, partial [Candidatus Paenibacillus intestinavium]|nr:inositol 2-dehydrogenase [Candidatus Paenibacillus intestinavium]
IGELGDIDTAIVTLRFANGALGVVDNSRKAVYGYDQRVEVFGEKGNISVENDVPTTVKVSTEEAIVTDHPKYFFLDRYIESYETEVNCFVESILGDLPPLVSAYDGYQAERIAFAAKQSLLQGRLVRLEEIQ